ncbi:MAG: hypothetical protein CL691_00805 [Cellvibrionales bacterium]|nr:hypothetical protein [Cellvibrionales bacterium]
MLRKRYRYHLNQAEGLIIHFSLISMNKKVIGQTELNGFVMATRVADRGIIDANTANEKSNNNTFRIKI